MEKIKKIVGNNIREYTMVVALVVIVLFSRSLWTECS